VRLSAVGSIVLRPSPHTDFPTTIRRTAVLAVALLILGVAGIRIIAVVTPPRLTIIDPPAQLSTSSRIVTITGTTEPGVVLTINDQPFVPDATGAFTTDIVLLPGSHTIAIEARRRHSRPNRIERQVNVRAADAPVALGPKPQHDTVEP